MGNETRRKDLNKPQGWPREMTLRSLMVIVGLTALFIVAAKLGLRLLLLSLAIPLALWFLFLRRARH